MIKLYRILFESEFQSGWDEYDIDPRTGKLIRKASAPTRPKQEPDEPDGGVLGKYVFGNIRKIVFDENIEDEPDTELEKKIYSALGEYTSFNEKTKLNAIAAEMKAISDSGKYGAYFSVPSTTAWRVLVDLSKSSLENILGKKVEKDIGVEDSGIISPKGDAVFTGWTLVPEVTIRIYNQAKFESDSDKIDGEYVVLAKCDTSSNSFFFNIDAAMKYISVGGSPYDYQKEVLAYGDVRAKGIAYTKISDVKVNPVQKLLKLLT